MATQRYISTSFWDDEWIHGLDPSEKLLYLYFMTNTLTNIAGVYKIAIARMCFDTGFNENTMKHLLDKFEKAEKLYYFKGYVVIPSWPKHQKWESKPDIRKGIESALKEIPAEVRLFLFRVGYSYPMGGSTPQQPHSAPVEPTPYHQQPTYSDSDSDSDSEFTPAAPKGDFDTAEQLDPEPIQLPAVAGRGEITPLQTSIRKAFQSREPIWTKSDQEVLALSWLASAIQTKAQTLKRSPDDLALQLITKFWQLRQNGRDFWKRQPFYPSRMKGLFGDLVTELDKENFTGDGSWVDDYERGAS